MTKFSDLKLDPNVLRAIAEAGYETPTPIQAGAIPPALEGRDVLGIAQTGTGKTASFTLPMITLLGRGRARARMPRSLVLCPTRELAAQVAENFDIYAKHTRLTKALLIGGVSFGEQDKLIDRGVDVLIATPGRLLDHFERGKLLLTGVQVMVVDEADRMLDMGFIPDIERIFQLTPFTRQTLFFSATMAPEIERITDTFLHAPERIEVARQATTSETITQRLVEIIPTRKDQTAKQKRELLRALIKAEGDNLKNAIIFCNRKTDVDIVAKSLKAHGFDAAPIHGDLDQRQRMATLDGFRDGTLRLLVASDVAARGLDIPAVSHVFNFDLPSHAEDYVHRIGRTGRAGRLGTAVSISTPLDEKYLTAIEALVKTSLPRGDAPEGFTLSDAAQSAPRPRSDRGDRNGRGRTRSSRERAESTAPRAEPRPDPAPAKAEQPEPRREEPRRDEPRREERSNDRNNGDRNNGDRRNGERRDGERRDERRDDRRAGRDRDRGPHVMGMGDHVPDFMLTSFRPAFLSDDSAEESLPVEEMPAPADAPIAVADVAAPAKAPVTTPDAVTETPKTEAPAPRKRSRARKAKPEVTAESTVAPAASVEAPSEATASAPASPPEQTDAPAKPKRTRSRKKPVETAVEADAATEEPAPKPKRTRSRKKAELPADPLPEEREAVEADPAPVAAEDANAAHAAPAADALPEEREAVEAERGGHDAG